MDALAAYGSDSDDSGSESMPVSTSARASPSTPTNAGVAASKIGSLSSLLPPPKSQVPSSSTTTTTNKTSSVSALASIPSQAQPKTSRYHTLPTLEPGSDSDEEESVFRKKAKLAEAAKAAGSGLGALFAMLPAPKGNPTTSSTTTSGKPKPGFMPRTVKKPTPKKPPPTVEDVKEDDDDDEDGDEDDEAPVSFFPLGAAVTAATLPTTGSSSGKAASNSYIPLYFDKKPLTTEEQKAQSREEVEVSMTNEQYAYAGNDQYAYNEQYDAYQSNAQYAYPANDAYAYGTDDYTQSEQVTRVGGQGANGIDLDDVGVSRLSYLRSGLRKNDILKREHGSNENVLFLFLQRIAPKVGHEERKGCPYQCYRCFCKEPDEPGTTCEGGHEWK